MVNREKQEELANEILNRLYEEADPGLNWDDLVENPEDYPDNYYEKHKISSKKQEKIIEEVLEEHGVDKEGLPVSFWFETITDKAPSSK